MKPRKEKSLIYFENHLRNNCTDCFDTKSEIPKNIIKLDSLSNPIDFKKQSEYDESVMGILKESKVEDYELESIAYYLSYNCYKENFGIYINISALASFIKNIYNEYSSAYDLDFDTTRKLCIFYVLQHERFHYLTEIYITQLENSSNDFPPIYCDYMKTYKHTFLTQHCLAETLANYYSKMVFAEKRLWRFIPLLNDIMKNQAQGYKQGALVDERNETEYYYHFEEQMYINSYRRYIGNMLKDIKLYVEDKYLPLGKLFIGKKPNVPIYIVNDDNLSEDKLKELINFVFPN